MTRPLNIDEIISRWDAGEGVFMRRCRACHLLSSAARKRRQRSAA